MLVWSNQIKHADKRREGKQKTCAKQFSWYAWYSVSVQVWREKLPPRPTLLRTKSFLRQNQSLNYDYSPLFPHKLSRSSDVSVLKKTPDFLHCVLMNGGQARSGGSSVNNAKVLPAQTKSRLLISLNPHSCCSAPFVGICSEDRKRETLSEGVWLVLSLTNSFQGVTVTSLFISISTSAQ